MNSLNSIPSFRRVPVLAGAVVLGLTVFGSGGAARADLVPDGFIDLGGTGIGAVNTLLTLQERGNEIAAVGRMAGVDGDVILGDAKTGANQTQTFTFAELGVASASDLRLIVNLNEPDNAATLNSLVVNVYDPAGNTVFSGGLAAPLELNNAAPGQGNAGFAFKLNAIQTAELQNVYAANLRVGVAASLSGTAGGNETIQAVSVPANPPQAIPEPGSVALIGFAVAPLVGIVLRRRGRKSA